MLQKIKNKDIKKTKSLRQQSKKNYHETNKKLEKIIIEWKIYLHKINQSVSVKLL